MIAAGVVLGSALVAAAASDARTRRIPNELTGGLALVGVIVATVGVGRVTITESLMAGALSFTAGLVLQLVRLVGGGDVKLFSALSTWLGFTGSARALLATALFGGVLALVIVARRPHRARVSGLRLPEDDRDDSAHVPYGVAIALGGLLTWFQ
jgi:prepilin peptidase CpaA